jgi:hypothetical protein
VRLTAHPDFAGLERVRAVLGSDEPVAEDVFSEPAPAVPQQTERPPDAQDWDIGPIPKSTRRLLLASAAVLGACMLVLIGTFSIMGIFGSMTPTDPWGDMPIPFAAFAVSEEVDPTTGAVSSTYMSPDSPRTIGNHFKEVMGNSRGWNKASLLESAGEELSVVERAGLNLFAAAVQDAAQILHYRHHDGRMITIGIFGDQGDGTMFFVQREHSNMASARLQY